MDSQSETMRWLLDGDPTIVWQVQRDLLGRAESTWMATRHRVAREGWGARLLSQRSIDGTWGGGLYGPKWTSTFYTLRLLTHLGLPPRNRLGVASCSLLLDEGVTEDGGVSLWNAGWTDTCVTAMLLSMACYFELASDARVERMVTWLLGEQMSDGGWNCERNRGATHASFHTTMSTLEGLNAFETAVGALEDIQVATKGGRDFFLEHQLYLSSSTGGVVRESFTRFSFPTHWYFDVLRGLEHFAAVNAQWDGRLEDPVAVLEARRGRDNRWKAQNKHTGKTHFELEPARKPSRMNTLRALRVLRWVERVR